MEEVNKTKEELIEEMYEATLYTTFGEFQAYAPASSHKEASDDVLENIKKGMILKDGDLLMVGQGTFLGIKVHKLEPVARVTDDVITEEESPNPLTAKYGDVIAWDDEAINYLCADYNATFLTLRLARDTYDRVFIMLYKLKTKALKTTASASATGQANIIREWISRFYVATTWSYSTVIPHGDIDDEAEAIEYLKDYVKETEGQRRPTNPTGKAFYDWRPEPKEGVAT